MGGGGGGGGVDSHNHHSDYSATVNAIIMSWHVCKFSHTTTSFSAFFYQKGGHWILDMGSGDSLVVRESDLWSKGPGFECWQERRENFLLQGQLSVLTLISVSIPPRVTTVAHKRSWSFCQKCRWQVTAKHTYTLPMWLWMKWHCNLVHGWMVYTELAPKRQHFTWHQPCNIHRALPVYHFHGY